MYDDIKKLGEGYGPKAPLVGYFECNEVLLCPECHAILDDEWLYCPFCGQELARK